MEPRKSIVEFIGAFFLVFTIGMCVIAPGAGPLAPLAIGSVLMVMVYAGGPVSGAHYNPAVTLAVLLRGQVSAPNAIAYVIAQCLGAALASFLVLYFKGLDTSAAPDPRILPVAPVLLAEFLFTFALCYVVLNVATVRSVAGNSYFGLAIGFTVLAGALAVGPISGGAFNPAVVLGLGIMRIVEASSLWPHLLAQAAAALVAALAFKAVHVDDSPAQPRTRETLPKG